MYLTYDVTAAAGKHHVDQLIDEASRFRLAAALRRGRRRHWPDQPAARPRTKPNLPMPPAGWRRATTTG